MVLLLVVVGHQRGVGGEAQHQQDMEGDVGAVPGVVVVTGVLELLHPGVEGLELIRELAEGR